MPASRAATVWVPIVLWAGAIFAISSIPSLGSGLEWDFTFRKLAHVGEFAVLGFLLARALARVPAFLVGLAYAVSDELHQAFVPGRQGSARDVAIDALGVLIGVLVYRRLRR